MRLPATLSCAFTGRCGRRKTAHIQPQWAWPWPCLTFDDLRGGLFYRQHDGLRCSPYTRQRRGLWQTSTTSVKELRSRRLATSRTELVTVAQEGDAKVDNNWEPIQCFTYKDFQREAYVLGPPGNTCRLVDNPAYHNNFELWAGLLEFRLRVDGFIGALEIWKGIHQRHIDLPTVGQAADRLWEIFVSIGLQNKRFLMELWDYVQSLAERTKRRWDALYERILSFFLKSDGSDVSKAWVWHLRLNKVGLPAPGAVRHLIDDALYSKRSLLVFKRIYADAGQLDIYDKMISSLCDRNEFREAELWHHYLMDKGDLPSNAKIVEPLRAHLGLLGEKEKLSAITERMVNAGVSYAGTLPALKENIKISRERMNEMVGDTYGFKQRSISDSFAARWFATKSLSVEFIIIGMAALGSRSIGPLAMRELAARCTSAVDLKAKIAILEKNNVVDFVGRYVRALHKIAREGREDLFRAIMASDQHPEVYDDLLLQRKLLSYYMRQQDKAQIEKTLFILGLFDNNTDIGRWNRILESHITAEDRVSCLSTLEDMLNLRIPISPKAIKQSFKKFMPRRVVGKAPQVEHQAYDGLSFVANMWLRILQAGGEVPPTMWKQLIIGFGMLGRLKELEALTVWLATHYSKQPGTAVPVATMDSTARSVAPEEASLSVQVNAASDVSQAPSSSVSYGKYVAPDNEMHPMNIIFPTLRKRAIVEWGFLSLGKPTPRSNRDLGFNPVDSTTDFTIRRGTTQAFLLGSKASQSDTPSVDSSSQTTQTPFTADMFSALEDLPALNLAAFGKDSTASSEDAQTFSLDIPPFSPPIVPPSTHPHLKTSDQKGHIDATIIPGFARGLALLRHLHTLGVPVRVNSIRTACQHRLRELFEDNTQIQTKTKINRLARENNELVLSQVVRACNTVWGHTGGRQLFRVKEEVLQEIDLVDEAVSRRRGKVTCREGWLARRKDAWRECLGVEAAERMEKVHGLELQRWVDSYRGSRKRLGSTSGTYDQSEAIDGHSIPEEMLVRGIRTS